jgi:hypothetical protein
VPRYLPGINTGAMSRLLCEAASFPEQSFDRAVLHEAVLLFKNPESFCFDAKFSSELI